MCFLHLKLLNINQIKLTVLTFVANLSSHSLSTLISPSQVVTVFLPKWIHDKLSEMDLGSKHTGNSDLTFMTTLIGGHKWCQYCFQKRRRESTSAITSHEYLFQTCTKFCECDPSCSCFLTYV